ncbi:MAG: hypothetical protein M1817_004241 [Caeruleum heppii]|nr:MAG: hypothetical protein M1817_004241 [Caeruleum heppii]
MHVPVVLPFALHILWHAAGSSARALEQRQLCLNALDKGPYDYSPGLKGISGIPFHHDIWVNNDPAPPPPPKKRTEPVSSTLVVRAPPRNLEMPGYREIALTQGVLMIHTVAGELGDASTWVIEKIVKDIQWAGDHIFELNMLEQFFNFYNDAHLKAMIMNCDSQVARFRGILNAPSNLIGLDAKLNGLKMLFLQKNGPRDYRAQPAFVYHAMLAYFQAVQPMFMATVARLAVAMNDAVDDRALVGSAGDDFRAWAEDKWATAIKLVTDNLPALAGQGNWERIGHP